MSHVTCDMSNAYVDRWDMLKFFCFQLYAQKSLFIAENCNVFFGTSTSSPSPSPVSLEVIELKMVGRLPATAVHSITTMSEIRRYIDLLTTLITDQASCTWDNHNKSFFLCNEWSSENKTWGLFKLLLIEAIVQSNRDFFSSHISSYVQPKNSWSSENKT